MDKGTQPPQTNTEIQRREYYQTQAASSSTLDDESFQSLSQRKMELLDKKWSPNDLDIFKHPMWLISTEDRKAGEDTKKLLKCEEKAFEQIAKIDWPIVVVAVAGLYKSGKSYLMNRLAESSKGFEVGDTIERTTKGIWAWCKIHPTKPNTVLLLLDTEGLGDVEKGDPSHDNKIFTLATLLCNCLVYNMKGTIDYDAFSKLTFVTEMASNIRFRGLSSEDNQSINLILPDFVLCLRDFSLKLIKDGKNITANDFLEQSLAENKSKTEQFNKPRACIRKYFMKRECFAFPVPCNSDDLENLETLSITQLSTRFKDVTTLFTSYIYTIPPKDLLASKPLNGRMFITLADRYVTAIKNGAVPDVDDAFKTVAKIENAKIEKKALEIFENEMEKEILPVSEGILGKRYTSAQEKSLHYLRQNVVHDFKAKCEIQAQREMDGIWDKIKTKNEQRIREKCDNTLQNVLVKYLEKNLTNQAYNTAGGYRRYKRDVERTKDEYVKVLKDFKQNEILLVWYAFVDEMTKIEANIIEADENMSQKDKEAEQRQNQKKLEELLAQHMKAQKEAFEKEQTNLTDHYEKLDKDRGKQKAELEEMFQALAREKLENAAARRVIENYKRLQLEAEEEMARYKDELENLRKQLDSSNEKEKERKNRGLVARLVDAFRNE